MKIELLLNPAAAPFVNRFCEEFSSFLRAFCDQLSIDDIAALWVAPLQKILADLASIQQPIADDAVRRSFYSAFKLFKRLLVGSSAVIRPFADELWFCEFLVEVADVIHIVIQTFETHVYRENRRFLLNILTMHSGVVLAAAAEIPELLTRLVFLALLCMELLDSTAQDMIENPRLFYMDAVLGDGWSLRSSAIGLIRNILLSTKQAFHVVLEVIESAPRSEASMRVLIELLRAFGPAYERDRLAALIASFPDTDDFASPYGYLRFLLRADSLCLADDREVEDMRAFFEGGPHRPDVPTDVNELLFPAAVRVLLGLVSCGHQLPVDFWVDMANHAANSCISTEFNMCIREAVRQPGNAELAPHLLDFLFDALRDVLRNGDSGPDERAARSLWWYIPDVFVNSDIPI
jgi:hypothetical protein